MELCVNTGPSTPPADRNNTKGRKVNIKTERVSFSSFLKRKKKFLKVPFWLVVFTLHPRVTSSLGIWNNIHTSPYVYVRALCVPLKATRYFFPRSKEKDAKLDCQADNEVKDEKGNLITKPFKCFSLFFSCLISLFKCIRNDVRGMQQRSLSIYTRKKNTHPPFFLLSFEKWSSFFH